jgi:hypothetical protein
MPTRGSVAPARQTVEGGHHLLSTSSRTGWSINSTSPTWRPTKLLAPNRARAADVAALAGVNPAFDRVPWVSNSQNRLPGYRATRARGIARARGPCFRPCMCRRCKRLVIPSAGA